MYTADIAVRIELAALAADILGLGQARLDRGTINHWPLATGHRPGEVLNQLHIPLDADQLAEGAGEVLVEGRKGLSVAFGNLLAHVYLGAENRSLRECLGRGAGLRAQTSGMPRCLRGAVHSGTTRE